MNELIVPPPPSPPPSDDAPRSPTESEGMADWEQALQWAQASSVSRDWKRTSAKPKSLVEVSPFPPSVFFHPLKADRNPPVTLVFQLPFAQDLSSFVRSHPEIPLPELPLEVLLKILEYIFLRPSPTTPASPHQMLNGTTHLLLVSKSFRTICLPIFFRSVTIYRTSDFATFFDSRRGIFVVTAEGRKRWDMVKELCIVDGVQLPLEGDDLLPLTIPSSHQIDQLVILEHKPRSFDDWDFVPPQLTREEEEHHAASQRRTDQQRNRLFASTIQSLREEQIQEGQQHQSFEEWIQARTGTSDVHSVVSVEVIRKMWEESFDERRELLNRIVLDTSPRQIHISLLAQRHFLPLQSRSRTETVVIHYAVLPSSNRSWPESSPPDVVELAEEISYWLNLFHVQLVDFPRSEVEELVERVGKEPSEITRWTWRWEDGSSFEMLNDASESESALQLPSRS
ncbi:hypothetical protein BDY24DRAFT_404196 [Mrakia frigida]|uniref:uncharacterized protein n=1 Tax=Mrakia frigida TaxID=29902 RepID=UPI003FCC1E5B